MPQQESTSRFVAGNQAEKAPLDAKEAYRLLFDKNPEPMFVYDMESLAVLAVNQAALDQYGYSHSEFLGMTILDLVRPGDEPALVKRLAREAEGLYRSGERKHRRKDGSLIDVDIVAYDIDWAGLRARLVLAADITYRKRAEELLRQSEHSYRQLVELSPDALLVHRDGRIIFANAASLTLFKASNIDELLGKQLLDLVHPDDRDVVQSRMQTIAVGEPPMRLERKYTTLQGQALDVEVMASALLYQGEIASQVSLRDISERKMAERKLRRSEANLTAAQRFAHLGTWEQSVENLVEINSQPIRWSKEVFRMFGIEPTQGEIPREVFLRALHPEDRERAQQALLRAVREGTSINHDYRVIRPDGSERVFHSEGYLVRDEITRKPSKVFGTLQDITERKQAENELRHLAEIVKWSTDAIIGYTVDGIITSWNAGAERMCGYTPEEAIGQPLSILSPPDQLAKQRDVLARMKRGENVGTFEATDVRKDGGTIMVSVTPSIIKDPSGKVVASSSIVRDITAQKKAEERFYKAFNLSPEPMTIATTTEGRYVDVNESFLRVTGYQREEVIGRKSLELKLWENPADRAKFVEIINEHGSVRNLEFSSRTKSGELWTALASGEGIELAGEKCIIAILKDVTEQKLLEKQLRQAQKMEAIGRFSGGIAHDFNNLLGVIIGYSEVLEEALEQGGRLRRNAAEIKKAGQRAASLTQQILAFSRQQVLAPKVLNLNTVVADTEKMLRRLLGEDIQMTTALNPHLGQVKADQGQIEQIIMNLAVNARDAMPEGGKLIITTENQRLDEEYALHHLLTVPGNYVMLSVTDTGVGMDAQILSHIFEPFFTTKELGKGTGLGLATVYGVVKQSGGYIWVYSEPGLGTTFKILLPRVDQAVQQSRPNDSAIGSFNGSETILLVEDEESLRTLTRTLLEQSGYAVLDADGGSQAIEIAQQYHGPIHLLLTDMVMPGMNGRAVAERVMAARPQIKVIYMSGYSGFAPTGALDSEDVLLPKPITREALVREVYEVLSQQKEPATI